MLMISVHLIGCSSTLAGNCTKSAKMTLVETILSTYLPSRSQHSLRLSLSQDENGCPQLNTGLPLPFTVSFSYCEGKIWAAVAVNYPIGLDVESRFSFAEQYPYHMFLAEDEIRTLTGLELDFGSAAAAAWSCKEAVAKSMQCGFSTTGPLDLKMMGLQVDKNYFAVDIMADRKYRAVSRKKGDLWLSLAGPTMN